MTGLVEWNHPAFFEAQRLLESVGYQVLNPARREVVKGKTWEAYMKEALIDLCSADAVALLPNWTTSRGATMEVEIANVLMMEFRTVGEWLTLTLDQEAM